MGINRYAGLWWLVGLKNRTNGKDKKKDNQRIFN